MTSLKLAADEVLLAVADRVGTNHALRRASRTMLMELARAGREHPEWLQGGFVANGKFCHIRAKASERLADNLRSCIKNRYLIIRWRLQTARRALSLWYKTPASSRPLFQWAV